MYITEKKKGRKEREGLIQNSAKRKGGGGTRRRKIHACMHVERKYERREKGEEEQTHRTKFRQKEKTSKHYVCRKKNKDRASSEVG